MGDETGSADQSMVGLKIKVIGVGSGSCNAVAYMLDSSIRGADLVSVDTDWRKLSNCRAQTRLPLGTSGLAVTRAHKAQEVALQEIDKIRDALGDASLVVVLACLGAGTSCGVSPVVARAAKDMGILTVGVVTTPFDFEGPRRMQNAVAAIAELRQAVDTLLVFENEAMLDELGEDATQDQAYAAVDQLLTSAVSSIVATNHGQWWAGAYYDDMRAVLQAPGANWWGTATAEGADHILAAVHAVVEQSKAARVDLASAKGLLVTVAGREGSVRSTEHQLARVALTAAVPSLEHWASTVQLEESLGHQIRVTVWATGLPGGIDAQ